MLSARGNPEVGLPLVDRLIKERNYNEAILVLAEYMTEHPEDFDGAQRRVRRIITMREGYNEQALELLDVIANEPTNDAKKLDMITSLESMEKNPNERTQISSGTPKKPPSLPTIEPASMKSWMRGSP